MRAILLWLATCLALGAEERRLASYNPGATRTLVDLGAAADIVMATRWCPLPKEHPAARDADVFLPDLERLLNTRPGLVILPRMTNPLWAEKCAKAGLRTLVLSPESADSVRTDILALGAATGRSETARRLADQLGARPDGPTRSLLVVWEGVMAGPESYLAGPMAAAGWHSALPAGAWPKFDWERLSAAKPDAVLWISNAPADGVIVESQEKNREMSRRPLVRDLPCIRNGRVFQVENRSNYLPGSGLCNTIAELTRLRKVLGM